MAWTTVQPVIQRLIGQKSQNLPTPFYSAPSFGVTFFEFMEKLYTVPETGVFQAADGEDLMILACTIFDWSTRVTDGQTDGPTDKQNCDG